uniref:Uncharacterized protein n=1 Tax=Brassica oleracea var. oleracea TaxID=109376 RepID=A0A0D3BFD5_BRAOL
MTSRRGSITLPPEVFYPSGQDLSRLSSDPSGVLQSSERGCVSSPSAWGECRGSPGGILHMLRCRMWFPIPEAIVRALDRFELSISQLNIAALQNFLGVLILSYELWSTRKTSIDYSYRMAPKRHMSIIQGHTSNAKGWFECFFYVRIDGPSVEENCLPLFRGKWNFHRANSILPAIPIDLFAKCDLLRNGPFFWDSFTLDMIWNAVALYRSRGISRPSRASDMDEPHPNAVPDQRVIFRPRKDKGIALEDKKIVSEDLPLPGWNPGFTPGDGSGTNEAPLPDNFFANLPPGFTTPASLDEASRREVVAEGSRLINEAEEIKRKFVRFQNEVAEKERRQAESHSRALIRAERKGSRRTLISLFSPRLLRCRASWMGAPRPSRWFLQSRGGSESFGNPSRYRRTRRKREPMLRTREEKWISPHTHLEPRFLGIFTLISEGRRDCFPFAFISRFQVVF